MSSLLNENLHDDMNFYATSDSFIVEPNGKEEILIIGRVDNKTRVAPRANKIDNLLPIRRICGVLGTIRLLSSDYLLVATHRLFVGVLKNSVVWRLAGYEIIPYIANAINRAENDQYLDMLRKTLDTQYFYFSYAYDMTHTMQRQHRMSPSQRTKEGLFERADKRFVWNGYLLDNFECPQMQKFQLPLILGFVSVNQVQMNGQTFFWSIISRRSVQRAGTRHFSRGIDDNGDVSNYVETEQIVEFNGQCLSFVQTRGSMPFFWQQLPNLRYKPRPHILPGRDHLGACKLHFEQQITLYGRQVAVNLVDQKGAEGELEDMYRTLVREIKNSNVRYEAFDFHAECKKMRWDRLNILIDRLAHEQDEFSLFHAQDNGNLVSTQTGVFRTNCIDCLDRTNVVQSMLARRSLTDVLQRVGILQASERVEYASPHFETLFKCIWADNADLISLQYSGTGALKTDFTRTGKRTTAGMLQDGCNSLKRYCLNNFADGLRQDGIDLFLGNYKVSDSEAYDTRSPLNVRHTWRYKTFPWLLLFAVILFVGTIIFPTDSNTEHFLLMLFWGSWITACATGILHYGIEFVQWPRLFPPIRFAT